MNKEKRGILIGMILGDGCIRGNELCFGHSLKQKEYLEYKAGLIYSIFGGRKTRITDYTTKNGHNVCRFGKSDKYIGILRKKIYKNNVKYFSRDVLDMLTIQGIALWYMDDGSLTAKYRNNKIHAYDLTLNTYISKEENEIIINYFKEIHNLEFKLSKGKGKYRLRMGTREARKFINIIKDYIIPSMKYKIDIRHETPAS